MRTASVIELTDEQRQQLQRWTRSSTVSVRLARRARFILLAAEGMDNHQIAGEVGVGRIQVGRWRKRFVQSGLSGIEADLPRSGRKRRINAGRIVRVTTQNTPEGATHWSTRTLAAKVGISDSSVLRFGAPMGSSRIWLRPSRSRVTHNSWRSSKTSSDCICRHPSMRWCCVATRRVKCRRWTVPSLGCP